MKRLDYATPAELALAVSTLARPMNDRPRWLEIHGSNLLLGDDCGGEDIASFNDATAVHFFLLWLRHRRAELAREAVAKARRAKLKAMRGGKGQA